MERNTWYTDRYKAQHQAKAKAKQAEPKPIPSPVQTPQVKEQRSPIDPNYTYKIKSTPLPKFWLRITGVLILIALSFLIFQALYDAPPSTSQFYDLGTNAPTSTTPNSFSAAAVAPATEYTQSTAYQNLTAQFASFLIDVPRGTKLITVETKFFDTLPRGAQLNMGAKALGEGNYVWENMYVSSGDFTGQWLVSTVDFDVENDQLNLQNNQIELVINAPHLAPSLNQTTPIPIDWINVSTQKDI